MDKRTSVGREPVLRAVESPDGGCLTVAYKGMTVATFLRTGGDQVSLHLSREFADVEALGFGERPRLKLTVTASKPAAPCCQEGLCHAKAS